MKIAIINGPNLNLLGTRETNHYGNESLTTINDRLSRENGTRASLTFFQSNHEGHIVDYLHTLHDHHGIIINPGAFTHTSIAIRDALLAIRVPSVEVHLSNIFAREDFRKTSYISDVCIGVISGFGAHGYQLALDALVAKIKNAA